MLLFTLNSRTLPTTVVEGFQITSTIGTQRGATTTGGAVPAATTGSLQ